MNENIFYSKKKVPEQLTDEPLTDLLRANFEISSQPSKRWPTKSCKLQPILISVMFNNFKIIFTKEINQNVIKLISVYKPFR